MACTKILIPQALKVKLIEGERSLIFRRPILALLIVVMLVLPTIFVSGVSSSEIKSGSIVGEASFFWDQDPKSERWIPNVLLFLNNTSSFNLRIDFSNVTFTNIVYEDGTRENPFFLSSKQELDLVIGGNLFVVVMSEYGFVKKPVSLRFELLLHVAERDGNLVFTSDNTVSPISMGRLLQSIMLQYDVTENGTVLATYSMTFRNLGEKEIRAQIAIRFLEESYRISNDISPSIDDPNGGGVRLEHLGKKTSLIYTAPYYQTIAGRSSYTVRLKFALIDIINLSGQVHSIKDLRLIVPAYVQTATLKVRIPKQRDLFFSLTDVDSSPAAESPQTWEISGARTYCTLLWTAPTQRDLESFYIINISRIQYQYSPDLGMTGLWDILKGVAISALVALLGVLYQRWRNKKTKEQLLQGFRREVEDSIRRLQNRKGQLLPNDQWTHVLASGGLRLFNPDEGNELSRAYFGIGNYNYEAKRTRDMGERYRSEVDHKSRSQIHLAWKLDSEQLFSMGEGLLRTLQDLSSKAWFTRKG